MKQENNWMDEADKELEEATEAQKRFMETEYKNLPEEERINYWSGMIREQFRWNQESGVDGYFIFTKKDYDLWKQEEPEMDKLLPSIAKKTKLCIDEINKRILE